MSLTTQFYTMMSMIGIGSFLGAALDTYGRFLQRSYRATWLVFINDIMFWCMQGFIIFYVLLLVNEGELRFYIFIAILCGYAAYRSLFQSLFLRLLEFVIKLIISTYQIVKKLVHYIIIKPIQILYHFIAILVIGLLNVCYTTIRFLVKVLIYFVQVLFIPVKKLVKFVFQLLPSSWRKFCVVFLKKLAGYFKKIKNVQHIIIKWWKSILSFLRRKF
ncbi:spore cortex biosynthesis protein YabQ [Bacillus sp. SM2101]|uniref:spore cortex biosynthesis protein YabQ n=1 Tax=Bacillus sp. SM2101 TaxID=2805366 RepID=UPI001BDDFA0C|nr:spore cortex biosynthesis protein YabQ [Bacillus sp. SM2101]